MTLSQAMSICHRNKIIAYGVNKKGKLFVEVVEKKVTTKSKKLHNSNESLNDAVSKTYLFYANKLTQETNPPT
jgi:hypothetical protein